MSTEKVGGALFLGMQCFCALDAGTVLASIYCIKQLKKPQENQRGFFFYYYFEIVEVFGILPVFLLSYYARNWNTTLMYSRPDEIHLVLIAAFCTMQQMVHRFGLNYRELQNLINRHQNSSGFLKQILPGYIKVKNPLSLHLQSHLAEYVKHSLQNKSLALGSAHRKGILSSWLLLFSSHIQKVKQHFLHSDSSSVIPHTR